MVIWIKLGHCSYEAQSRGESKMSHFCIKLRKVHLLKTTTNLTIWAAATSTNVLFLLGPCSNLFVSIQNITSELTVVWLACAGFILHYKFLLSADGNGMLPSTGHLKPVWREQVTAVSFWPIQYPLQGNKENVARRKTSWHDKYNVNWISKQNKMIGLRVRQLDAVFFTEDRNS